MFNLITIRDTLISRCLQIYFHPILPNATLTDRHILHSKNL
ncbi:hypothetical protein F8O53_10055 [Enterobacter sp. 63]